MANTLFAEKNKIAWVGVRPGAYGEQVAVDGTALNGTTVLYTVGVGKVLLVFNTWFTGTVTGAGGGYSFLGIYTGVPAVSYRIHGMYGTVIAQILELSNGRFVPLEVAEGYSIRLVSSGAGISVYAGFEGLIVDPLENA